MGFIKSTLNAIDKIPQSLVKFMDWATDGNKVADTKKALDQSNDAYKQARTTYNNKHADFNVANKPIADAEKDFRLNKELYQNHIRDAAPRLEQLYNAAIQAEQAGNTATRNKALQNLVTELTPFLDKNVSADDRAIAIYKWMYPGSSQTVDASTVYDLLNNNALGPRNFKRFFNNIESRAYNDVIDSLSDLQDARNITRPTSSYITSKAAYKDARNKAINARNDYYRNKGIYEAALANQENKLKNARAFTGMTLGGGTLLGIPTAYYASDISDYLGQAYRDFIGQSKSPNQEVFNEAGNNALTANSEPLPDPSIQGQSFRLPGMVTANPVTPPVAPAPVTSEAPATVPPPTPVLQEQPVAVAPAPSSEDTYGYLDKALNRPKQSFTPTIQGRRTPSQEAALAKGMFDYRRQSARNALNGLSPAEAVQRGIIPYEALAYV